jgi:vacuolar-type H+-ATPase subunit I/STV1
MDTTIDPDLERRFQHYYRLLALEERDDQQEATLQKLHRYLQKNARPALGNTRRDQLVYEILDAYLSDRYQKIETGLSREEYMENRKNKRRETLKKVQDIWDRRKSAAGTGTVQ